MKPEHVDMPKNEEIVLQAEKVGLHYGQKEALRDVWLSVPKHKITALIGPSGCGKSTLLRGLSKAQPIPQIHLRKHCLGSTHQWLQRQHGRTGGTLAPPGSLVGRSQRPPA